ncbi:MAG: DUF3995 domain-containing protein [Bacteroidota bacterium]
MALLLALPLVALSVLHLYWAAGGRWGSTAVVPTQPPRDGAPEAPVFTPGPLATVAVGLALAAAAWIVLGASAIVAWPFPRVLAQVGMWGIAAVFLLRAVGDFRNVGITRRIWDTTFARLDSTVYTPLCAVLGGLALAVAWLAPSGGL